MSASPPDLCPRDGAELEAREHLEVAYLACRRCGGLWFGRDDLTRLEIRTPKGSRPPSMPAAEPQRQPQGAARCICQGHPLMALIDRYGVTLDVCPACGGLWLDAGEIERILQCYEELGIDHGRPRPYQPATPDASAGEVAGDALAGISAIDLGLDALGSLFDFLGGA